MPLLADIVREVVKRTRKFSAPPATWTSEDLEQEAWVAVLEAEHEGLTDPHDIRRRAENRLQTCVTQENQRLEIPMSSLYAAGLIDEEAG